MSKFRERFDRRSACLTWALASFSLLSRLIRVCTRVSAHGGRSSSESCSTPDPSPPGAEWFVAGRGVVPIPPSSVLRGEVEIVQWLGEDADCASSSNGVTFGNSQSSDGIFPLRMA